LSERSLSEYLKDEQDLVMSVIMVDFNLKYLLFRIQLGVLEIKGKQSEELTLSFMWFDEYISFIFLSSSKLSFNLFPP
jgi:hypothetical protein